MVGGKSCPENIHTALLQIEKMIGQKKGLKCLSKAREFFVFSHASQSIASTLAASIYSMAHQVLSLLQLR
jgi:hypothetical protein